MISTEEIAGLSLTLGEALKPYQRDAARRVKLVEALSRGLKAAERGDAFALAEVIDEPLLAQIDAEPTLSDAAAPLRALRAHALEEIASYQLSFREDLLRLSEEAALPMSVDFPRFSSLKGIDGQVDFTSRTTTLNGKPLKTVDPARIIAAVQKLRARLYAKPLDGAAFIEELHAAYLAAARRAQLGAGEPAPVGDVYLELVLGRQSKRFLQDMDKGAFTGYSADQLAVDLWRMFESNIFATAAGELIQLRAGRSRALWLIDRDGERRQISTLSFARGRS
jgi:hypothetical protein